MKKIKQFFIDYGVTLSYYFALTFLIWSITFRQESFAFNLISVSKIFLIYQFPALLLIYALFPKKDQIVNTLFSFCAILLFYPPIYFISGKLGIIIDTSIYIAPIILVLVSFILLRK